MYVSYGIVDLLAELPLVRLNLDEDIAPLQLNITATEGHNLSENSCIAACQVQLKHTYLDQLAGEAFVEDLVDPSPSGECHCVHFVTGPFD